MCLATRLGQRREQRKQLASPKSFLGSRSDKKKPSVASLCSSQGGAYQDSAVGGHVALGIVLRVSKEEVNVHGYAHVSTGIPMALLLIKLKTACRSKERRG